MNDPQDKDDELAALRSDDLVARYNRAGELLALAGAPGTEWVASVTGGEFYLAYPRQADYHCTRAEIEQGIRRMEAVARNRHAQRAASEREAAERAYWAARDVRTVDEPAPPG